MLYIYNIVDHDSIIDPTIKTRFENIVLKFRFDYGIQGQFFVLGKLPSNVQATGGKKM